MMKLQAQTVLSAAGAAKIATVSVAALALAGCSLFSSDKRKPAELEPNVALLGVKQTWTQRVGKSGATLLMNVSGSTVTISGQPPNTFGESSYPTWQTTGLPHRLEPSPRH